MSDVKYCMKCGRGVAGIGRAVAATRCGFCGGRLTPYEKVTLIRVGAVLLAALFALVVVALLR